MSKKRIVEIIEQNGIKYGQTSSPNDLTKAQEYAHAHAEQITQDFLMLGDAETSGCNLSMGTLMTVNLTSGRVYRGGLQYEAQNQTLTHSPAHIEFGRIDVIVAVLTANSPANTEFLAFQRLRTEQELNGNVAAYPPTQFQRATEQNNIAIKPGTPSASPQAPALAANEVALYQVIVPANASSLLVANITDLRKVASNLRTINTQVATLIDTVQELLRNVLVLKYRFPTTATNGGRCPAQGALENGAYVIDIPRGVLVEFGDRFVYVDAVSSDSTLNARFAAVNRLKVVIYQPIFENNVIAQTRTRAAGIAPPPGNGNAIRINAPSSQKWLYLSYEGELFLRSTPEPSNSNQCLLLRITPSPTGPLIKEYVNIRNSIISISKTAFNNDPTSRQFELENAFPVESLHIEAYAVRAADGTRYDIPLPTLTFDAIIEVTGVANGDKWVVNLSNVSAV